MRTFYDEVKANEELGDGGERAVRIFLRISLYGFWGVSLLFDTTLMMRTWGSDGAATFVFWLLFRQALVFLALWFTVALAHGLLVGRRTPPEPRRKRRPLAAGAQSYSRR